MKSALVRLSLALSIVLMLASLFGCVDIDKSKVRAQAGAPESAQVEQVFLPYDSSLPRYVMVVEPIRLRGTVSTWQWQQEANVTGSRGSTTDKTESKGESFNVGTLRAEGNSAPPSSQASKPRLKPANLEEAGYGDSPTKGMELQKGTKGTSTESDERTNERFNAQLKGTQRVDSWHETLAPETLKMSAQLTSALSGISNFKVMTKEAVKPIGQGRYSARINSGEKGPFVFKALITEYDNYAEATKQRAGALIYSEGSRVIKGVVGIDVSITNGRDGSIVASFPVRGTFSSQYRKADTGILPFYSKSKFARSVMDQALRVALNRAAIKAYDALTTRVP